jgi:hypothetical protein
VRKRLRQERIEREQDEELERAFQKPVKKQKGF